MELLNSSVHNTLNTYGQFIKITFMINYTLFALNVASTHTGTPLK